MAVTNQNSTQVANGVANPPVKNKVCEDRGRLRTKRFNHVQVVAGDATSTVILANIPPGLIDLHLALSRIAFSAFGAARVLDIGHSGYTKPDGTVVAAAPAAFANDIDVSGAGNAALTGVVGADEIFEINSRTGTTILATVAGGTIPDAATLDGNVNFSHD